MSEDHLTPIALQQEQKKSKRYNGIDAMKGFGIWVMLLIHCLIQQEAEFDSSLFINTITRISYWWYPLLIPIAILSLWGPFFAFAYVTTLSIQIQHIIDTNPKEVRKFLLIRLLIGVLILTISKIGSTVFSYRFFERGHFTFPYIGISYESTILDLIAWSGFIVPSLISILCRRLKIKNPYRLIAFLVGIILIWFVISPSLANLGNNYVLPWLMDKDLHFLRYLVSKLVCGRFKMLPVLSFGFLGGIYGTMLYHEFSFKKIISFTLIFFGTCTLGFALWHFLIEPDWILKFASEDVPIPIQLVNMGTMPFLFLLFLHNQDFAKTEKRRVQAAKRVTWWRRYSLISLTAYALGTDIAFRVFKFFTDVWGPSVDRSGPELLFAWNIWQLLAFIATMWIFWEILIRIWEKINYLFSIDWFLAKCTQLLTGQKMARLNVKHIIYEPNKYHEEEIHS